MFKKLIILYLSIFVTSQIFANVKIGYVDMQQAIQSTTTGKKAKKDLEKAFEKKKKELKKKEEDLVKMREDFEKKSLVLADDVRMKKAKTLQEEMLKYRELVGKSQMDIQKRERELTLPILEKLRSIISEVAKADGYSMILEKSEQSVLWAKEDMNLTDKIVKLYEKKK
jgi:outer membrane protein